MGKISKQDQLDRVFKKLGLKKKATYKKIPIYEFYSDKEHNIDRVFEYDKIHGELSDTLEQQFDIKLDQKIGMDFNVTDIRNESEDWNNKYLTDVKNSIDEIDQEWKNCNSQPNKEGSGVYNKPLMAVITNRHAFIYTDAKKKCIK